MARRTTLGNALDEADDNTTPPAPAATTTEPDPPADAQSAPKPKKTGSRPKNAKKSASERAAGGRSRPAGTRASGSSSSGGSAHKAAAAPDDVVVRAVSTRDAARASIYLHPDDYRELRLAAVDDGADLNARLRAMIAVWRTDARVRSKVDRLARTAPRGGT